MEFIHNYKKMIKMISLVYAVHHNMRRVFVINQVWLSPPAGTFDKDYICGVIQHLMHLNDVFPQWLVVF